MAEPPRIVLATPGPAASPLTWSGSALGLLEGLRAQGVDPTAVDVGIAFADRVEQLGALDCGRDRTRQRHHGGGSRLAGPARRMRSGVARRRLRGVLTEADAVVQVGHWHHLAPAPGVVRACYADANAALAARRDDALITPADRGLARTRAAEARVVGELDRVLAMSRWLARSYVSDYGVDPSRIRVVGLGANVAPPDRLPVRDPGAERLLFVGRSFVRKGGPELLEAFALLRERRPGAELVVVGPERLPGPVPPGVVVVGRLDRSDPAGDAALRAHFAAATAFVLPSRYEPFGSVLLEAMGYGLPCVATRACAMPEVVANGVTGWLARPGDPRDLAACLHALLEDRARADAMGTAGRRRALSEFAWPAVGGRVLEALR